MRDAVGGVMRADGQRSHMRMGTVLLVIGKLGRKNGVSRQCGSTVGQSASVAQKAEQLPMEVLPIIARHWALWQNIVGSLSDEGVIGQTAPDGSVPKERRQ